MSVMEYAGGAGDPSGRARELRRRLVDLDDDLAELCAEAASVFSAAGSEAHVRWLARELGGYPLETRADSVHETLGLSEGDRLVVQVTMYRAPWGRIIEGPQSGSAFRHFFVEPVRELGAAHDRIDPSTPPGRKLRLDFDAGPSRPWLPVSAKFPVDVFHWILLGLRAMLHRELGQLVP